MIDSTRAFAKLVAAFNQNDWPRARQRALQLLAAAPGDAQLLFMAGVASMQLGRLDAALGQLLQASQLEPRRADYAAQYARALMLARRLREARRVADRAMTLAPHDAPTLDTLGAVYLQAGAPVQAATAYQRAVAQTPGHAPAYFNLAAALRVLGDQVGAERALENCIERDASHWRAHLALAELATQSAAHNHLPRLQALLARHADDPAAQVILNLALGKEYDDLADYRHAFEHWRRGKGAGYRLRPGSAARDEAMFDALIRAFPPGQAMPADGDASREPVFLMGLPYTGGALLDRMLGRHPEVSRAGELPNFPTLLQQATGSAGSVLAEADPAARTRQVDWRSLGTAYLASTRPATGSTARFTDRLAHHYLYAPFLARALPNAKLICLRREPLDTCLENFRHLLSQASPRYDFALDLYDTGRYCIQFDRLMAHWRQVLPGRILEVDYESLLQEPQTVMRRVLDFCELPWHADCASPTPDADWRAAGTDPLGSPRLAPVGHWQHYAEPLRDLRHLLAQAGLATAEQLYLS